MQLDWLLHQQELVFSKDGALRLLASAAMVSGTKPRSCGSARTRQAAEAVASTTVDALQLRGVQQEGDELDDIDLDS